MKQEFVRNPYNYDSDKVSDDTGLLCKDESLTEQEHLDESDINYIADKFLRTGMAPQIVNMPTYGDFEGTFDFQTAMNVITQAKREFMALPAKIRTRFDNDPQQLLTFLNDTNNRDEAIRLGLIEKPATIDPQDNQGEPNVTTTGSRGTTQNRTQRSERPRGTESTTDENQGTKKP